MEKSEEEYGREIGQRIVQARRELGMSQVELKDLIHVSERTMQAYESGEVIPYRKLKELSMVLDKPMPWILHGEKGEAQPAELVPVLQEIAVNVGKIVRHLERKSAEAV